MIKYPEGLPRGLHSGRTYQTVSPLQRSPLENGRARQRRRFTNVPTMASVSWIFNSAESQAFEAWWRDQLIDGSQWFECPLETPLGYQDYTARFTDIYSGPSRLGPLLWSYSAEIELRARPIPDVGWGEFPEFIIEQSIFDYAMNREWPRQISYVLLTEDGYKLLTEDGYALSTE